MKPSIKQLKPLESLAEKKQRNQNISEEDTGYQF